jgi:hypothetical protein
MADKWHVEDTRYDLNSGGASVKSFYEGEINQADQGVQMGGLVGEISSRYGRLLLSEYAFIRMGRRKWYVARDAFEQLASLPIDDDQLSFSEILIPYDSFCLIFERGCKVCDVELSFIRITCPRELLFDALKDFRVEPAGPELLQLEVFGNLPEWLMPNGACRGIAIDFPLSTPFVTARYVHGEAITGRTKEFQTAIIRFVANALLTAENLPEQVVPLSLPRSERYRVRGGETARRNSIQLLPDLKKLYEHVTIAPSVDGPEQSYHVRRMHWRVYRHPRYYSHLLGAYALRNGNWVKPNGLPIKQLIQATEVRSDKLPC